MGNLELMLLTSAGISVACIIAALLVGEDTGKPA
jgi:hypothetical protein